VKQLLIITPVKDSMQTAMKAIERVCQSKGDHLFSVYNDYSTPENRNVLAATASTLGFELINIEEQVSTPSPNYRFTLQNARQRALELKAGLLIVESDVYVQPETIEQLFGFAQKTPNCGMAAAITVNENGQINFPYTYVQPKNDGPIASEHRLSFCCTLLTLPLLQKLDFAQLSEKKDWFDVQISKDSRRLGFTNYILPKVKVVHLPHSSRPWKKLKYTDPVKYYFRKWVFGKDKI
jgi:hypothetical protein